MVNLLVSYVRYQQGGQSLLTKQREEALQQALDFFGTALELQKHSSKSAQSVLVQEEVASVC